MYLLSAGPFPFTAEDIRAEIGLRGSQLDPVIEAGIASICLMSTRRVRREEWAIRVDAGFRRRVARMGRVVEYGPRHQRPPETVDFVACTFGPDWLAVEQARRKVVAWCMRQGDILDALVDETWPKPVSDPVKLGLVEAVQVASDVPPPDWRDHREGYVDGFYEDWDSEPDNGGYPEEEGW